MPSGWSHERLNIICSKIVDGNHNPPAPLKYKTDFFMISSQNVGDGELINLDKVRYLSAEQYSKENKRTMITYGDILFTSVGTIGRSYVYRTDLKISFQRSVSVISTFILPEYLKIFFDAPSQQLIFKSESAGTSQKGYYLNQLSRLVVAIPPIKEQQNIVNKTLKMNQIINNF